MKKQIMTVAIALATGAFTVHAQDLTSKKGEPILPEEGDWGIGIDATPFLNYAGNFFGKTNNNTAPTFDFLTGNQTIVGKYFKDATTAYRAAVRLGFGTSKQTNYVKDNTNTSPDPRYVQDTRKVSYNGIGLSGGIEFRKGKTRLQGYYGGEIGIYFGSSKETYTYGNAFNNPTGNITPTSTDWSNPTLPGVSASSRVISVKNGSTLQFGIRGFIGAEFFILPKISIGGEFGLGLGFSSTGEGTTTKEYWGGSTVKTTDSKIGKKSSFKFDTDNVNSIFGPVASLRMNLYF